MPASSADIVIRYTVVTGSAGDSTASSGAASLGKYASTSVYSAGANTLFDDVPASEALAGDVEYRGLYFLNNGSFTIFNPVIWVSAEVALGAAVALAVDNITASAKASASAQLAQIANEDTAPTGVGSFSSPTTQGTGLSLGASLAPGFGRGFWVRRTVGASTAAIDGDGFTLGVGGE